MNCFLKASKNKDAIQSLSLKNYVTTSRTFSIDLFPTWFSIDDGETQNKIFCFRFFLNSVNPQISRQMNCVDKNVVVSFEDELWKQSSKILRAAHKWRHADFDIPLTFLLSRFYLIRGRP